MKKVKQSIIDFYNKHFRGLTEGENIKSRRLIQDSNTGILNWSEGDKPFEDEDLNEIKEEVTYQLEDNEKNGTRVLVHKIPNPSAMEPFFKNRFKVEFPGIPAHYFSAYKYIGVDKDKSRRNKTGAVETDYSEFKVLLAFTGEIDICEKFKELEKKPKVGDIKIHMLDLTGVTLKTIVVPKCEVVGIEAFRPPSLTKCYITTMKFYY